MLDAPGEFGVISCKGRHSWATQSNSQVRIDALWELDIPQYGHTGELDIRCQRHTRVTGKHPWSR